MIATASKSLRRKALAAANARAVLALTGQPMYSLALNEQGEWFVQSIHDVGFSASGMYHNTKESAELELEIINCDDFEKAVELRVRLIGAGASLRPRRRE